MRNTGITELKLIWLGEQPADLPHLKELLAPYPAVDMVCWPVSARVGNVKNNELVEITHDGGVWALRGSEWLRPQHLTKRG
jgi:hypothetical protein